jgi:TetR/AcrR family transcriptional regulator
MKKKGQSKKSRMSGEERRSSIIDAALELFAEKGFSGTRTREIAERAGISETLIFQHFKTKQALYGASFEQLVAGHPPVKAINRTAEAKDDAGTLREIALHAVEHCRHDPRLLRMSLYGALEGLSVRSAAQENSTMSDFLAGYIEQRIKDGVFHRVNARLAARLFFDSILMYLLDQKVTFTGPALPYTDEEAVETLVAIFLNGLCKPQR